MFLAFPSYLDFLDLGGPFLSMKWVLLFCYLWTALLCQWMGERYKKSSEKLSVRVVLFWKLAAALMLFLGITGFFNIQSFFTECIRQLSHAQGWYNERSQFQLQVIYACLVGMSFLFLSILYIFRKVIVEKFLALFGVAFLCGFVAIRAVSYHDVDSFLGQKWIGLDYSWIFEFAGIFCVAVTALWNVRLNKSREVC